MTLTIGITGGIGSGKSTLTRLLAARGWDVLDGDSLTTAAYHPVLSELRQQFGPNVVSSNGVVNKKLLASIVFRDAQQLRALNRLLHPVMKEMARQKLQSFQHPAVFEAAILFEAKWNDLVDRTITVIAPENLRVERIIKRNQITQQEALMRIRAQMTDAVRLKYADFVVYNVSDLASIERQVNHILNSLECTP